MAVEVTVPTLGESVLEATVGRWFKQPGDPLTAGEALVELETDKVNMDVVAPEGGRLQSIAKQEGETVGIGDVLGLIDETANAPVAHVSTAPGTAATGQNPPTPANPTPPGPAGADHMPDAVPTASDDTDDNGSHESGERDASGTARVTPLARRVAAEHGVDITQIQGSGPSGRVTREDVAAFVDANRRTAADIAAREDSAPASPSATPMTVPADGDRPEERVRMSRRRQTIARRLVEAVQTAAMLTTFNEVDMTAIMNLRQRRREQFKERYGVGLGFMSFFTKAVIVALKDFPRLNAEIQGDEILLKHYFDIGVAVGTDEGLVVPVVRHADRLTFAQIEREIGSLANKARTGQLSLAELQGGTFTISNGGIYGSLLSTPILNTPQVGILGMHKIQERPVVLEGEIVIRPMMYLALSYDHRIVDGSEAVRFLVRIKEMVEDPERLLIEV